MKAGISSGRRRLMPAFCCLLLAISLAVLQPGAPAKAEDTHTPLEPIGCVGDRGDGEQPACFILHVPSDWNDLSNRPMELPVLRFPPLEGEATEPPLLVLGGGPGQSVVRLEKQIAKNLRPFRAHREMVLMDQRGTGPLAADAVLCQQALSEDGSILLKAVIDCTQQAEADQHYLSDFSTAFAVEDYHALRNALDIDQWAIIATSYGARVAQGLVRRDEEGIERVLLNGPLLVGSRFFDWNPFALVEKALELCNEQDACRARYPDLYWDFQRLPFDMRKVKMAPESLSAPIQIFLYRNRLQSLLARHQLDRLPGDIDATMQSLSDALRDDTVWTPPQPLAPSMKGIGLLMHFAILCAEEIEPLDDKMLNELDQPLQMSFYRRACSDLAAASSHWITLPEHWNEAQATDKPVLIMNGEFDTVVDPSAAASALPVYKNSAWVQLPHAGHDLVSRIPCARTIAAKFLDGTAPKDLDQSCVEDMKAGFKLDVIDKESTGKPASGAQSPVAVPIPAPR